MVSVPVSENAMPEPTHPIVTPPKPGGGPGKPDQGLPGRPGDRPDQGLPGRPSRPEVEPPTEPPTTPPPTTKPV